MFRRDMEQMTNLTAFSKRYSKGKLALGAYRSARQPLKEMYGSVMDIAKGAKEGIRWLNGALSTETNIPEVDISLRVLQEDPTFRDVSQEIDSFYTDLENLGTEEERFNAIIESAFNSLGITLSPEEEKTIKADYAQAMLKGEPILIPDAPLAPPPSTPDITLPPVQVPVMPIGKKRTQTGAIAPSIPEPAVPQTNIFGKLLPFVEWTQGAANPIQQALLPLTSLPGSKMNIQPSNIFQGVTDISALLRKF